MSETTVGRTPGAVESAPVRAESLRSALRDLIPERVSVKCRQCNSKLPISMRAELRRMHPNSWIRIMRMADGLERERASHEQDQVIELEKLEQEVNQLRSDVQERDDEILRRTRQLAIKVNDVRDLRSKIGVLKGEADDNIESARDELVRAMLPILDAIDDAVKQVDAQGDTDSSRRQGLQILQRGADSALSGAGYESQQVLHKPFNPGLHNAVATVDNTGYPPDTIVGEVRRGYVNTRSGEPVRHAEVTVAVGPLNSEATE